MKDTVNITGNNKDSVFGTIAAQEGCLDIVKLLNVDAYEYARQFGQLEIAEYIKEKLEEKKKARPLHR